MIHIDARSNRILIVDADEPSAFALRKWLLQEGFDVYYVRECADLVAWIDDYKVELVILSALQDHDQNGLSLLVELRKKMSASHLPVLMVDTPRESYEISEFLLKGANDFLSKPLSRDLSVARVRSHMVLRANLSVAENRPTRVLFSDPSH